MSSWSLVGKDRIRITVDGARVVLEQSKPGGKSKATEKVHPDAAAALTFARGQVQQRVLEGAFDPALSPRRVPWSELGATLGVPDNNEQDDDPVLVFDGATALPHSLLLDYREGLFAADAAAGIVVEGDLTIDGDLINFEDDYGPFLVVRGDLTCRNVATGGARVIVQGTLRTGMVIGVYNHGLLRVAGGLETGLVASEHTVDVQGPLSVPTGTSPLQLWYGGFGDHVYGKRADGTREETEPYEPAGVFAKPLVTEDAVDLSEARRRCANGKPVLLEAPESVRATFRKKMAKQLEAPEKVKTLSLPRKGLSVLPAELFAFTALEKLDLTHNRLRALPPEIGRLTQLKVLILNGNGLVSLPEELGDCTALRELDLEANCVTALPDSLERCTELRRVNLRNNPYSYVPNAFGGWDRVRFLEQVPEVLTRLPSLSELVIEDTLIRRMPSAPFVSRTLGPVALSDTLITEVDQARFPQFVMRGKRSDDPLLPIVPDQLRAVAQEWADAHIGFWFSSDGFDLYAIHDPRTGAYDFRAARAALTVVLRTVVPAGAPYDATRSKFEEEALELVRRLRRDKEHGEANVRHFFAAMGEELALRAEELAAPALTDGLASLFASLSANQAA